MREAHPDPPSPILSLEEALHRHAKGDRNPLVMSTLNQAAWDAFHTPWEAPHPELPMQDDPMKDDPPEALPPKIQPLTQAMLAAWMDKEGLKYFQHPTRGLLVDFIFGLRSNRSVTLRTWLSGRQKDILVVNLTSDRRVPPESFVRALRLCNDWNQQYRWPRAMVEQDYRITDANEDPPPAPEDVAAREDTHMARICLDFQVCLSEGIHQEALDIILTDVLATSWDFWRLANNTWGL